MNIKEQKKKLRMRINNLYAEQSDGTDNSARIAECGRQLELLGIKAGTSDGIIKPTRSKSKERTPYQEWKVKAIQNGVRKGTYEARVRSGYSYEESAQLKINNKKPGPKVEHGTWMQIADDNGIKANTFKGRLRRGWTEERAATFPLIQKNDFKVDGKVFSLADLKPVVAEYDERKRQGHTDIKISKDLGMSLYTLGKVAAQSAIKKDKEERLKWKEIALQNGLGESGYYKRLDKGWEYQRAATEPRRKGNFSNFVRNNKNDKEQSS